MSGLTPERRAEIEAWLARELVMARRGHPVARRRPGRLQRRGRFVAREGHQRKRRP